MGTSSLASSGSNLVTKIQKGMQENLTASLTGNRLNAPFSTRDWILHEGYSPSWTVDFTPYDGYNRRLIVPNTSGTYAIISHKHFIPVQTNDSYRIYVEQFLTELSSTTGYAVVRIYLYDKDLNYCTYIESALSAVADVDSDGNFDSWMGVQYNFTIPDNYNVAYARPTILVYNTGCKYQFKDFIFVKYDSTFTYPAIYDSIVAITSSLSGSHTSGTYSTSMNQRFPSGNIIKSGMVYTTGSQAYYGGTLFPTAFPSACTSVLVSIGQQPSDLSVWQFLSVARIYNSGFDWSVKSLSSSNVFSSGATDLRFYYVATGY